ncbi:MAG: hypothetical protein HYS12_23530 [Planctomycetes bacterium]|nr:hypothetical protein [Planctomycetota bacterium]
MGESLPPVEPWLRPLPAGGPDTGRPRVPRQDSGIENRDEPCDMAFMPTLGPSGLVDEPDVDVVLDGKPLQMRAGAARRFLYEHVGSDGGRKVPLPTEDQRLRVSLSNNLLSYQLYDSTGHTLASEHLPVSRRDRGE